MNPTISKNLRFVMSDDEGLKRAIRRLSSVFHVVPSGVPDAGLPLLNVEIDGDHFDLCPEVREIIAESDQAARELHDDS